MKKKKLMKYCLEDKLVSVKTPIKQEIQNPKEISYKLLARVEEMVKEVNSTNSTNKKKVILKKYDDLRK